MSASLQSLAVRPSRLSRRYLGAKAWENYLKVFVHPPHSLSTIPGYLHPLEGRFLYWLAGRVPAKGLVVEVGSYKGKSSAHLAAGLKATARLACVDTWTNDAMPYDSNSDVMPEFLQNTEVYREKIAVFRGTSVEIAKDWTRPIDLLFVDGDHSYEGCSSDLKAWLGFVRPGGRIAFHDSSEEGVSRAISELFPPSRRASELQAWSIFSAIKVGD